jgi:hypothetical protein
LRDLDLGVAAVLERLSLSVSAEQAVSMTCGGCEDGPQTMRDDSVRGYMYLLTHMFFA